MKLFYNTSDLFSYGARISLSKLVDLCPMPISFETCADISYENRHYSEQFVKPYLYAYQTYNSSSFVQSQSVYIKRGTIFTVGPNIFQIKSNNDLELTVDNLDTGTAFTIGTDYYVYICDPSNGNIEEDIDEVYLISANSSYPEGYDESNSRKIGGFHYGRCRWSDNKFIPIGTNYELFGTNWMTNVYIGVIPNSVWTLTHRPICDPEGMVYVWGDLWSDIYFSTDNGNFGLQSKYNLTPLRGSALNWYGFSERAANVNKRLPTYSECCMLGFGSPAPANNNTYNVLKSDNSGPGKTGAYANAVSSYNVCDMVGQLYRNTSNVVSVETSSAYTCAWKNSQSSLQTGGLITTVGCGDICAPVNTTIRQILHGGTYTASTNGGDRAALTHVYTWQIVNTCGIHCVAKSMYNKHNLHINPSYFSRPGGE